eukprot:5749477-Amphidinium_carterae.2
MVLCDEGANEALRHDLGGGIRVGFGPPATSVSPVATCMLECHALPASCPCEHCRMSTWSNVGGML